MPSEFDVLFSPSSSSSSSSSSLRARGVLPSTSPLSSAFPFSFSSSSPSDISDSDSDSGLDDEDDDEQPPPQQQSSSNSNSSGSSNDMASSSSSAAHQPDAVVDESSPLWPQNSAAPSAASFQADPRASAAAAAQDAEEDAPACMICMESASDRQTGRLYQPCPCSHVHVSCLAEWRARAPNAGVCPTCKIPYRIGRERWAVVIGHPLSSVFATLVVVIVVATILAELVRLGMDSPRPPGLSAQVLQVVLSAWRAAEVLTGLAGFLLTICAVFGNVLDSEGAKLLWEMFAAMVAGDTETSAWMSGFSTVLTTCGSALTVWATHRLIRYRLQEYMMRAAERVLDIKEW